MNLSMALFYLSCDRGNVGRTSARYLGCCAQGGKHNTLLVVGKFYLSAILLKLTSYFFGSYL